MVEKKVQNYIKRKIEKGKKLHFTLIDPDPKKVSVDDVEWKVKHAEKFGTDAIMIGGSTGIEQKYLDKIVKKVKECCSLPTILFPNGINGISKYADAIFFMSLLNSRDPFWISHIQAQGALRVKKAGIEPIPMGYIVVEPGMKVGKVGRALLIRRKKIKEAVAFALAAEYMGMSLVYLEAGSGAHKPVPTKMVKKVRETISIPLIVGGGIREPKQALERIKAGADIIVTGTITEENFDRMKEIIHAIKNY